MALSASASVLANDQMKPAPMSAASSNASKLFVSDGDQAMMKKLAQSNMAEVASAEFARTRSTDMHILKFADLMIEDHTKAQKDLADIAGNTDMELPKQTDAAHGDVLMKMQPMVENADFDRAYKDQTVEDHMAAQNLLKQISANAKNADFKALAKKLTPAIDQHLKMSKALKAGK